ncbi:MAG: PIN domain nuclease [Thermoanaerobaculia bacterium]|nr:PIN domain nuclease [Thermoanaerobaculia bacterium]
MNTLVDSSVWADFLNRHDSAEARALDDLLRLEMPIATCGLVAAEVCQGLKSRVAEAEDHFRQLHWVEPNSETYFRAAEVFRALRSRGITIRSTVDCIVVVLAEENDCFLLARDRDMTALLASGLVRVRAWPV